jgi:hypothetical protein
LVTQPVDPACAQCSDAFRGSGRATRRDVLRWSARLTRSIELRDGTELDTLADAANFILALPDHYQDRNSWKRATELLMQAAEQNGDIEAATEQLEQALFLEARYVRR